MGWSLPPGPIAQAYKQAFVPGSVVPISMFACVPSMYKYLGKRLPRGTVCKYMVVPWRRFKIVGPTAASARENGSLL